MSTSPWVNDVSALVGGIAPRARIGVSGFHFTRAPIAAIRALAESDAKDLHYIAWGGGLPLEVMLDLGLVTKATLCFSSLDALGPAPRFRQAVESGRLELDEWTALGLINGMRAAGENLAYEVMQEPAGSSLARVFSTPLPGPFGADNLPISAVPPLPLDVLLLHAGRADADGNVEIAGARGLDMSAIFAAREVLVTVEERVARGQLGAPRSFILPRTFVTKIAEVPFGAYPTSCLPYYSADFRALRSVVDTGRSTVPADTLQPTPRQRASLKQRAQTPAAKISAALRSAPNRADSKFSVDELMVAVLARTIGPTGICSVGSASPMPTAAYLLAKHLWAPDLLLMSHNGGYVDPPVRPLSLSTAEQLDFELSSAHTGGDETYHWYYQRGLVTHEVVGSAQVDRRGATNNLWVTKGDGSGVRLPGQGGMADVANLHANFMIYLPRQSIRNTPTKVATVSAQREWHDAGQRRRFGLQPGKMIVLTDLGLFEHDQETDELVLHRIHPGVTVEQLRERTGFDVRAVPDLQTTEPPSADELHALRNIIDPLGIRRLDMVSAAERQKLIDSILDLEENLIDRLATEDAQ